MSIQVVLLLVVVGLIIADSILTYKTYKITEKDYTSMRYDVERMRVRLDTFFNTIENHEEYIGTLKESIDTLEDKRDSLLLNVGKNTSSVKELEEAVDALFKHAIYKNKVNKSKKSSRVPKGKQKDADE